ncbi:MAG: uroporphyrinogen decarboxylase family protein [Syntrophobacteraceae bacterium]
MIDFTAKDTMTAKERLLALAAGRAIDRVPFMSFALGFAARVRGIDRGEIYRNPEKAFAAGLSLMKAYPWMNGEPAYGWADKGAWEFGGKIIWPDGDRYPAPWSEPVISRPEEVDSLPDPDPAAAGMTLMLDRFNTISRENGFPASLPGGTPTTLSAGIAGRVNFLRWLIKYPEAVHKIQRKVTDFILRAAKRTIREYGAENCSLDCGVPMESNQLISVRMFESFAKPYIREIFDYYASKGVQKIAVHLCGDHTWNLAHWNDIPLPRRTIFSISDEMDLERTGQIIGKDHILAGNINSGILCAGTPEMVSMEVRRCLEAGKKHPGGFVLMPACEFPPDTPLENVDALADALFEYGYY